MLLSWGVINLGLLDKILSEDEESEDSDAATERAHEILQIVGERVEKVRPSRVIFASVAVLLILSGIMIIGTWIVPLHSGLVPVHGLVVIYLILRNKLPEILKLVHLRSLTR